MTTFDAKLPIGTWNQATIACLCFLSVYVLFLVLLVIAILNAVRGLHTPLRTLYLSTLSLSAFSYYAEEQRVGA